ncbi:hypothetical protein [Pseudovibrio sp. SPO723]|uniref:hypothetical protein n=1 Tax=Nesiotobacter zosterae TaxID=392721 RepID=UPI0029C5F062|nr:hypothetical protein [Pseudovibrio sp. SPO723]MDX5595536.1 hypothetical protein [Pseudovibrio sp. SPO723]
MSNAETTDRIFVTRNGDVQELSPRIEEMLLRDFEGLSLDLNGDTEKRPDFLCLGGELLIEMKSLTGSPQERIDNAVNQSQESIDLPRFYGDWPLQSVLKNLEPENALRFKSKVSDRLGRAIRTHIKKARGQLASFAQKNPSASHKILILTNEGHEEYDPDTVRFIVSKELHNYSANHPQKKEAIDAVLFFTEMHALVRANTASFPIHVMKASHSTHATSLDEVISRLARSWKSRTELFDVPELPPNYSGFIRIENAPTRLTEQKAWEQNYRKNPYMQYLSDSELAYLWRRTIFYGALLIESPSSLSKEQIKEILKARTHIQIELSERGIPLDTLRPTKEDVQKFIRNMNIPLHVK